jgi:sulfate adenylyltransferase subunit 2
LHIDTTDESPEMLEFREWAAKHYGIRVIVKVNTEARRVGFAMKRTTRVTVTHELRNADSEWQFHPADARTAGFWTTTNACRRWPRAKSPRDRAKNIRRIAEWPSLWRRRPSLLLRSSRARARVNLKAPLV